MALGGSRPGAGRPKGAKDKLRNAQMVINSHAQSVGAKVSPEIARMTPLQVMLHAMALEANAGKWIPAAQLAKEAAPYIHAKLSSIQMNANVRRTVDQLTDEELITFASSGEGDGGTGEEEGSEG